MTNVRTQISLHPTSASHILLYSMCVISTIVTKYRNVGFTADTDTKASIYYKVVLFILQPMKRPDSPVYMNSVVFKFLIIWLAVWGKIKRCATDKSDDLLQYPFHPLGTTVAHKDPTLPKLQAALYSLTVTHMHPTYRVFMKWYGVHQDSSSFTWQHQTALYIHHFSGYLKHTTKSCNHSLWVACNATAQWVC